MGAETMPARTADSPITNAPTILTVEPTGLGKRMPASLSASNMTSINNASTTAGKGTPSRAAETLSRRLTGINWGWNVVAATYSDGSRNEIPSNMNRSHRIAVV
ncbi:hypothetical protein D3C77_557100 [compost metagenome]